MNMDDVHSVTLHQLTGSKDELWMVRGMVTLEKKIFPKHESLSESMSVEVSKPHNSCVVALLPDTDAAANSECSTRTEGSDDESKKSKAISRKKKLKKKGASPSPSYSETSWVLVGYLIVSSIKCKANILKLAVGPQWRRNGIASLLMSHVMDTLSRVAECAVLHVCTKNVAAQQLYLKHGFQQRSVVAGYYMEGRDAILMERQLK